MNSHGDVGGREACDLTNCCCIQVFEIGNDNLAIKRFQTLNQRSEPVQIHTPVGLGQAAGLVGGRFELFQADKSRIDAPFANDVRRPHVVRNAVRPRPQRTPCIVALKAPPELKVNFLAQIATLFRVDFVGIDQPFERRTELVDRLFVEVVLSRG